MYCSYFADAYSTMMHWYNGPSGSISVRQCERGRALKTQELIMWHQIKRRQRVICLNVINSVCIALYVPVPV